ncbi:MAG: type II secretion system protein GspN [Deltaproteobacteria bacterium]|nr:type II secretion system protein GspN [Deltaproteobacteria bacterium]
MVKYGARSATQAERMQRRSNARLFARRYTRGFAPGRWLLPALGVLLFLLVLLLAFVYSLPGEVLLSPLRSALGARGFDISCEDAGIAFPLRLRCRNAVIVPRSGSGVTLDSAFAAWEWTGLLRWLPVHLRAERGHASVDIRTSPGISNPRKVRLRLAKVGSDDLAGLLPSALGIGFSIENLDIQWERSAKGAVTGRGSGALSWLRVPVPAQDSPVREALLRDVRLKFAVRDGTVHVSSLTGTYEGSDVEGTGEIARVLTPTLSSITFHLRVRNPLEGKMAALFNLVAKNAKNANLRISGTLFSPTGEFQFF